MSPPWPFHPLRPGAWRVLLVDPPWSFATRAADGGNRAASRHYPVMDLSAIQALPVRQLAHPDGCWLVLWSTAPHMEQAMGLLGCWGFDYSTMGCWAKRSSQDRSWHMGTGYVMRSTVEPFIVARRGRAPPPVMDRSVRNLVVEPIRQHSRKPDGLRAAIEALWPSVPRAELFARARAPGWASWGSEVGKFAEP